MDQHRVEISAFLLTGACFSAAIAAAMLGYIAHYNFGLSREDIRTPALVGAVVIATLIAVKFFRKGMRKP